MARHRRGWDRNRRHERLVGGRLSPAFVPKLEYTAARAKEFRVNDGRTTPLRRLLRLGEHFVEGDFPLADADADDDDVLLEVGADDLARFVELGHADDVAGL